MTATLVFREDGTASGLHTDLIPLHALGSLSVRRASWIDFNESAQKWEVRLDPHSEDPIFSDPSREACLAWENQYFNNLLSA